MFARFIAASPVISHIVLFLGVHLRSSALCEWPHHMVQSKPLATRHCHTKTGVTTKATELKLLPQESTKRWISQSLAVGLKIQSLEYAFQAQLWFTQAATFHCYTSRRSNLILGFGMQPHLDLQLLASKTGCGSWFAFMQQKLEIAGLSQTMYPALKRLKIGQDDPPGQFDSPNAAPRLSASKPCCHETWEGKWEWQFRSTWRGSQKDVWHCLFCT